MKILKVIIVFFSFQAFIQAYTIKDPNNIRDILLDYRVKIGNNSNGYQLGVSLKSDKHGPYHDRFSVLDGVKFDCKFLNAKKVFILPIKSATADRKKL